MMTALLDPPEAEHDDVPPTEPAQLLRISANLLPDEIIAARRLARLKRKIALGLVGLVVLLAAGYGYSWWQTRQANDGLSAEQFFTVQLTTQLNKYTPLVQAQAKTTDIKNKLSAAMQNDVQWSKLLATLNRSAGSDVDIQSLSAEITANTANGSGSDINPLNDTGLEVVGDLKLTGTAPSYRSVAQFVDTLSTVKGLAVVDPASVVSDHGQLTFQVSLSLTTDVLGGRFSSPDPQQAPPASPAPTGGQ